MATTRKPTLAKPRQRQQRQLVISSPPNRGPLAHGVSVYRVLGVDLGQSGDPAAAVLLERRRYASNFIGPRDNRTLCRAIRRWPLGTDYCELVNDILDSNADVIVPEFNGVGRPVVDMLRREAMRRSFKGKIRPVVTASSNVRRQLKGEQRGSHWIVPKVDLITSIEVCRQSWDLVLPNVPEVKNLFAEMRDFQRRYSQTTVQFGNVPGKGKHDDIVVGLGLAAFWVVNFSNRELAVFF